MSQNNKSKVSIVMGSQSDYKTMKLSTKVLKSLKIQHEIKIVSAHRTPKRMYEFAKNAEKNKISVIIAGAGGAAITAGPGSHVASGKVTVFDKEGLYGISGPGGSAAQLTADGPAPNDALFSNGANGGALTDTDPGASGQVGIYVAAVNDTSLVSTTDRHAAQGTSFEHHAIYYMGNAAA